MLPVTPRMIFLPASPFAQGFLPDPTVFRNYHSSQLLRRLAHGAVLNDVVVAGDVLHLVPRSRQPPRDLLLRVSQPRAKSVLQLLHVRRDEEHHHRRGYLSLDCQAALHIDLQGNVEPVNERRLDPSPRAP